MLKSNIFTQGMNERGYLVDKTQKYANKTDSDLIMTLKNSTFLFTKWTLVDGVLALIFTASLISWLLLVPFPIVQEEMLKTCTKTYNTSRGCLNVALTVP